MLDTLPEIAGLEGFTDHDLSVQNDTPPDAIIVWFDVVKEYMPKLSEIEGKRIYKNFVHRHFIKELGHSAGSRRIKDEVYYNEEDQCWKVKRLAGNGHSDIKKFPHEWNRFQKGNNGIIEGTPIELIFKHDPSRADLFCRNQMTTVERLAGLTDADCQRGGMGWRDDRDRARAYLAKIEKAAGGIQNVAKMQELEKENQSLKATVADISNKLNILLQAQIDAASEAPVVQQKHKVQKSTKPRRKHPQEGGEVAIEGVE